MISLMHQYHTPIRQRRWADLERVGHVSSNGPGQLLSVSHNLFSQPQFLQLRRKAC